VIPAQKSRDLLYQEAAQEHLTQLLQLGIRPFPPGDHARSLGPLWIDDERADHAEERLSLGTLRPANEIVDFYIGHLTARRRIRLVPDEGRAGRVGGTPVLNCRERLYLSLRRPAGPTR
jgi:hypothetical protein